jgi:hypothetical protein
MAATLAFAGPPEVDEAAAAPTKAMVEKMLLKPLAAREHRQNRLSRVMQPASARRIRVLDAVPQKDSDGKEFVTFAVDVRYGWDLGEEPAKAEEWERNEIAGCAYPDSGEVFIKRGEGHYAAAILLGKRTKVAAKQTCVREAEAAIAAAK